jgi:hypothetical protein
MRNIKDFLSRNGDVEVLSITEEQGILGGSDFYSANVDVNKTVFGENNENKLKASKSKFDAFNPNTRIGCI